MRNTNNTQLILGQATTVPDGIWFAVAAWSNKDRDYVDDPTAGLHASQPLSLPTGSRAIRYTVHQGFVTTRRGLGK